MGNFASTAIVDDKDSEAWLIVARPGEAREKEDEGGPRLAPQPLPPHPLYLHLFILICMQRMICIQQALYGPLRVAALYGVRPDVWLQMCSQLASQKKARRASLALSIYRRPAILVVVYALVANEPPRVLSFDELHGLLASRVTCPVTIAFVQQFPKACPLGA